MPPWPTALARFRQAQTDAVLAQPDPAQGAMTIGVLGAGQLGRMMALAGYPLGLDFLFLDREPGTPVAPGGALAVRQFHRPRAAR